LVSRRVVFRAGVPRFARALFAVALDRAVDFEVFFRPDFRSAATVLSVR